MKAVQYPKTLFKNQEGQTCGAQTNGVEVKVGTDRSMRKEEWKAQYRQERTDLAIAKNDVDLELKRISSVLYTQEASHTTYGVAKVRLSNGDIELWIAGAGKKGVCATRC